MPSVAILGSGEVGVACAGPLLAFGLASSLTFYDRSAEGAPRQKGEYVVKQGTGVCFLPEDLHSIHIQAPLVNFHMYGLALDHLHKREYYKAEEKTWKVFPAHGDIREAR